MNIRQRRPGSKPFDDPADLTIGEGDNCGAENAHFQTPYVSLLLWICRPGTDSYFEESRYARQESRGRGM